MKTIAGFDVFSLTFDEDGAATAGAELDAMVDRAKAAQATDAIFIAHGFRNDERDATSLYTRFLTTFRANLSRAEFAGVASRRFVVGAVYWPSKPFREAPDDEPAQKGVTRGARPARARSTAATRKHAEAVLADLREGATGLQKRKLDRAKRLLAKLDGNETAQNDFVDSVLSLLDTSKLRRDKTEALPQIRKRSGSELLARLNAPTPGTRGMGDVIGSVTGAAGQFLNLALWYVMKDRSGTVGANGVASAVRTVTKRCAGIRVHLVGHSLGGRLMASCAKALCSSPACQPASVTLLEAAFSHYGFSPDNGHGTAGFFRKVIDDRLVDGPFLSTFSAQDTTVGKAYAISSRLARDNSKAIGDASDEFGGIGRNGALKTKEVTNAPLHAAGTSYGPFPKGVIVNLDGSGGLIQNHSDVTNEAVTYAFASAVART